MVHRDPRLWEDPEGSIRTGPRGAAALAYFPFGGGPRMCIGNGFATMEAQLVLATLAQRLKFELVPGHPVVLEPSITLRPHYGLSMTVR